MELSEEQQKQHNQWGWEFQDFGGVAEFSQVRTNMMKDQNYTPYCMGCPGLQRFGSLNGNQMICPRCKVKTEFPKDFIDRYKVKHGLI